ncbi:hypothetical protein FH508_0017845 [Lysinibacillus sp. CD3-6]|uniref:hypothetical protein n=1 Tax=Lysinibacillus sp. CD3-6 TaxID=2892541 RepID=UPI001167B672|nr:hypothetical protein [Lysinibacillus sp. CD3-6]UED79293.1 hypothetical protein FH508_0017845 [Lysinibacillus sp. CD3-6]
MLKRWGFVLCVSGILLGCSAEADQKDREKETNVEAESVQVQSDNINNDINSTDNVTKYLDDMLNFSEGIATEIKSIQALSETMIKNPSIIGNKEFASRVAGVANVIVDNNKRIEDKEVPNKFLNYHSLVLDIYSELSFSAKLFRNGSIERDDGALMRSSEHLELVVQLINKLATAELSKTDEMETQKLERNSEVLLKSIEHLELTVELVNKLAITDFSEIQENVEETANNNTIFDVDWNTFKKQWNNSLNSTSRKLSVITDIEEKPTVIGIRHNGQINRALFVSANTDENTGKVSYAVVIGATKKNNLDRNMDLLIASINLIELTDSTLTLEKRKQIALEHLGLGNGVILQEKNLSYSHNGITYKAEYEEGDEDLGTLTVSVDKRK